jgi:hypothetical protein
MVIRTRGINGAKVRFLQLQFPQYLDAIERQRLSLFFAHVTALYFKTFSYFPMNIQWMGERDDVDLILNNEQIAARRELVRHVAWVSRRIYKIFHFLTASLIENPVLVSRTRSDRAFLRELGGGSH